jgi:hypothetical protein
MAGVLNPKSAEKRGRPGEAVAILGDAREPRRRDLSHPNPFTSGANLRLSL